MKKVLYLANIRLPTEKAHGVQIMKTCEALAEARATVTLIVPSRRTGIPEDPFSYYRVQKVFDIKYVYCPDLIYFGKIGFTLMTLWFSQMCAVEVWRERADIVYSRDYFLLFDQWLFPQKKVWEVHDGVWNICIKYIRLSGIVAISNGLKDFYEKRGKKNVIVAHDAVDLKEFEGVGKADLQLPKDRKIVMYIGHLYGWKGTDTLLQASRKIDAQLVIIGGVDHEVQELRKKYPQVIFKGYLPYTDLPKNQKAADVIVIPNSGKSDISRLYTSPLKVFAHMTSGVPILASDLPSLREILNDQNAFFAEADNPDSFAKGIQYILEHSEEAKKKAEQAKRDVQRYTWEERAKNILDFFISI
jgi:glycosyltransferase involved in cell wall biosynthesis